MKFTKSLQNASSIKKILVLMLSFFMVFANLFVFYNLATVNAEENQAGNAYIDLGFTTGKENFTAKAMVKENKQVEIVFDFSHWRDFQPEAFLRGVKNDWKNGIKLQADPLKKTYTVELSFDDVKSIQSDGFKIYLPSLGDSNGWIPTGVGNNPHLNQQVYDKILETERKLDEEGKKKQEEEDAVSAFKKKYNDLLTLLEENVKPEMVEEIDAALEALGKLTEEQRAKLTPEGEHLTKLKNRIRSLEKEFKEVEEFINTYKDLLIDRKPDSATVEDRERVEEALEKYSLLSEYAKKQLKPMLDTLNQYDENIEKLEPKENEEQEETPDKKDKEEGQEKPKKPSTSPEKKESKPAEKKAEAKPLISFKSTSQDLTKEARTTSGKIKVNVDEESAKLVGAKEIVIKGHSYAKTAGFNPLNHELYDISLLDKDGNKITEFKRGFEAEVLLPVKSGREVLAVKHFLDPKDSTKQETLPSKEVEIAGQKYRKIKVSHFSVYGIEYKLVSDGKDKLPNTGASAGATSALVMLMGIGLAFWTKKAKKQ